jgi:hypothetical protein
MAITNISYFVICIDYGRNGCEGVVDPEMTFRGAVEKVREIIGDGRGIAFAHEITYRTGGSHHVSDVREELINRANDLRLEAAE